MIRYALKFKINRNKRSDFKGRWDGVASEKFSKEFWCLEHRMIKKRRLYSIV